VLCCVSSSFEAWHPFWTPIAAGTKQDTSQRPLRQTSDGPDDELVGDMESSRSDIDASFDKGTRQIKFEHFAQTTLSIADLLTRSLSFASNS
jgi:hypothetical protein